MSEMSNEKKETVMDIVAEKRREAQHIRNINDTPRGRREALDLDEEADRIEAAYKRECEATCKESFNVKAMREALESVRNWCLNRLVNASYQVTVEGLLSVVNEALSAPPRNCDMPLIVDGRAGNVADEAWLAFRRCNLNVYFDVPGLLRCIKWLFDEAKGETNGSK